MIPDSLYDLSNLEVLFINGNSLEGSISSLVGNLVKLTHLGVSNNPGLSGTLPSELGRCVDLEFFHMDNTQIEGTMPQEVCDLTSKKLVGIPDNEYWEYFKSDCSPDAVTGEPFFECDCCNTCCDHKTQVCLVKT